jgi:Cache 3/Cache 2 fusion domain
MGKNSMKSILHSSVKKAHVIGMCVLAFGFLATPVLTPSLGNAQDARVAKSMAALRDQTTKLGAPKIDGRDAVGGRDAPALYFGSTKMNNNFSVVDAVAEEGGRGTAATLFVKGGDDYIRVATNVDAERKWTRAWNCSDRRAARGDQSGQCLLRQGVRSWDALYQRL